MKASRECDDAARVWFRLLLDTNDDFAPRNGLLFGYVAKDWRLYENVRKGSDRYDSAISAFECKAW
jgi:hypothetical protein